MLCRQQKQTLPTVAMTCLFILPPFQHNGCGSFLIDFSKAAVIVSVKVHSWHSV